MKFAIRSIVLSSMVLAAVTGFAQHDHDYHAAAPAENAAPATCIVSGDKLGEMGKPVTYVYKQAGKPDRELTFCCKDCIADFEKEPAKYLAKLDGGTKATNATTEKSAAALPLVDRYIAISEALAADNLAKARSAADALAMQAKGPEAKEIARLAEEVASAPALPAARKAFKPLSAAIEPLVKGARGYVVMHCPMAKADWVQTDANVRNPYYGKMMLTCGAPKSAD